MLIALTLVQFGEDPDDAYSSIPYEKGANFLLYLERLLGGLEVFTPYAKDYVTTFRGEWYSDTQTTPTNLNVPKGKSIRTPQWKEHLFSYFEKHGGKEKIEILNSVDWDVRIRAAYPLLG